MTERTIQHTARELAGTFYDQVRSAEDQDTKVQFQQRGRVLMTIDPKAFGKSFPTVKDYLAGRRHGKTERLSDGTVRFIDDGSIQQVTPGWMHWYDAARQMLVTTLNNPTTHPNIKDGIMAALIEDREKQIKNPQFAAKIPQRQRFLGGG